MAVAHARNGGTFMRARAADGSAHDRAETAVELTYAAVLSAWLTLQPDIQDIVNPGTDRALANALAVGVRISAGF